MSVEIIVKKCPYCKGTGKLFYLNQDGKMEEIKNFIKINNIKDLSNE